MQSNIQHIQINRKDSVSNDSYISDGLGIQGDVVSFDSILSDLTDSSSEISNGEP